MPSYADIVTAQLVLMHQLADEETLWQSLRHLREAYARGEEVRLAEILRSEGGLTPQVSDRLRVAVARTQLGRAERLFAKLVRESGLVSEERLNLLLDRQKREGLRQGLGALLIREGDLPRERANELFDEQLILLAERRNLRERAFTSALPKLGTVFDAAEAEKLRRLVDDRAALAAVPDRAPPPTPEPGASTDTYRRFHEADTATDLAAREEDGEVKGARGTDAEPRPPSREEVLSSVQTTDLKPEECPIYGYEILGELGKGAMGVVYKARHIFTGRIAALKILPLSLARDSQYLERFKREAIAAMRLNHENIVRAYDFGGSDEYYYLALEFVDGRTLDDRLETEGRIPEAEALDFILQIARGLDHAWQHRVLHRDIKPENIMVTHDGVAKLCDFGIVKLMDQADEPTFPEGAVTMAGTTVGTPFYISPEQARGAADLDIRSDLYSLGVSLFHLLTGEVPFTGTSPGAILVRHILEEVPDPRTRYSRVSPGAAAIVRRMTRKNKDMRYPGAGDLVAELEHLLGH